MSHSHFTFNQEKYVLRKLFNAELLGKHFKKNILDILLTIKVNILTNKFRGNVIDYPLTLHEPAPVN